MLVMGDGMGVVLAASCSSSVVVEVSVVIGCCC